MSANHPRIPAILLAEDGSPGQSSDDEVDVTTQISNNFALLANLAGVIRFSTAAGKPSGNNYAGKVAQEMDTGNLFIHDGAQWQILQGSTFFCTSVTRPTAVSYTLYSGLRIFETDTKAVGIYDGAAWVMWDTQWQTYTPTWSASGTQPSVGNGSITGKYTRRGRVIEVHIGLIAGSTTTYGTGQYYFSVPFGVIAAVNTTSIVIVGEAWAINQGNYYMVGMPNVQGNNISVFFPTTTASTVMSQWGATGPWTFKNTDQISVHATIPI